MTNKVILLSNAYWPSIGGIENSLRHLAIEAKAAGDDVKIIVSDISVPEEEPNKFETRIDDVSVLRYPIAPLKIFFLRPLNIIASSWCLYRLMKKNYKEQPDSIVVARFHFGAVAANLAGFNNVRYLVPSITSNQYKNEKNSNEPLLSTLKRKLFIFLHTFVQKKALKKCVNYVFSETMCKQCMLLAGDNINDYFLTKPGVDQTRF